MRALDLFCGAGGVSVGLRRVGFDMIGVDIRPQPRYPFPFILGDALAVDPRGFDLVWASPPCQAYTNAQRIRHNDHPDLVADVRRLLRGCGGAWVIENVPGAPLVGPVELCGSMFGLKVYRHRLFECSFPVEPPRHPDHRAPLAKMGRPPREGEFMHVVGNFSDAAAARRAMGIDWMTRDELREAIPPAYAAFIGKAAMEAINGSVRESRAAE